MISWLVCIYVYARWNIANVNLFHKMTFYLSLFPISVELVASMGSAGLALSCLEALCTWLFGFKVTCGIIAVGVPVFCGLFALVAYYHRFFHNWPIIVCLIQLVLGEKEFFTNSVQEVPVVFCPLVRSQYMCVWFPYSLWMLLILSAYTWTGEIKLVWSINTRSILRSFNFVHERKKECITELWNMKWNF